MQCPVARQRFAQALHSMPVCPWSVPSTVHLEALNAYVRRALSESFPIAEARPKQPWVTEETWGVMRARAKARKLHRSLLQHAFKLQ
eukprot:4647493-Alexandrium_andersonii.AAC.1